MVYCATCHGPLPDINAACPTCLPNFNRPARSHAAAENAVRDILKMSEWSEHMQDDIVYTSLIRDYLKELERLR